MSHKLTIEYLVESAAKAYPNNIKMQKVAVTQAVHESGTLSRRGPSKLATEHKNLFGIKGKGTDGSALMKTWEHLKGKDVTVMAPFAKNLTYTDSFLQHKRLMDYSRYKRVREAKDVYQAFEMLQKCGYATDPAYPSKLKRVYDNNISRYYD